MTSYFWPDAATYQDVHETTIIILYYTNNHESCSIPCTKKQLYYDFDGSCPSMLQHQECKVITLNKEEIIAIWQDIYTNNKPSTNL